MWGAGGASGKVLDTGLELKSTSGGSGAFTSCLLAIPSNRILYLTVGGGGRVGSTVGTISRDAYGGGGALL